MNVKQFAKLGGKARAKALSKERRIEIARGAGKASAVKRQLASKSKQDTNSESNEKITENKVLTFS